MTATRTQGRELTSRAVGLAGQTATAIPPVAEAHLGYIAKMFPRISETFILKEVIALRTAKVPVRIYSLMPPTRDARTHPEAEELLPEVLIAPRPGVPGLGQFVRGLAGCWRVGPRATARELLRSLLPPTPRKWRRLWRTVWLAERVRRDRIGHLHAAWAHAPASIAYRVHRLTGVPWSMAAHAKDIHLSQPESLVKKLAAARFTLTCTRSNQELLLRLAGCHIPAEQAPSVECIYHGVDTGFFAPSSGLPSTPSPAPQPAQPASDQGVAEANADDPLIVSVGRLVPKKGFDVLISAAALLRERGVPFRLEIIGEGPLRRPLEDQIRSAGLSDAITLRGMLTRDEVRAAYRRAWCVALASRVTPEGDRDGIPNTLAEAMACGVPVVASRLSSIQELVVHAMNGLLVSPEDPPALADALEKQLRDRLLSHQMGRAGREWVLRRFDAQEWEARVVERLRRALGVEKVLYLSADRGVPVRGAKGASVHVRAVVQALVDQGLGVEILTTRVGPDDGPRPAARVTVAGLGAAGQARVARLARLLRGGQPCERALRRLADNVSVYRAALELGRATHPDLIYERYALTALAGARVAQKLKVPHVVEVNAPLVEEEARYRDLCLAWLARWAERWILRRADRVVVVSEVLAEHVRRLGVRPERVIVLPNGVDPRLFHTDLDGGDVRLRLGLGPRFVVGFSGTLKPWHGVDHLLRAVARARQDEADIELLLIGDGPERENLTTLARHLGLAEHTHFVGSVPHDQVGRHLAACDVLTAPYGPLEQHYFSPLKVAEYLAAGRPVIASAIGQLGDNLGPEQGVVLVPPGDEQALARALLELATDRDLRDRLAQAAADRTPWTWEQVTSRALAAGEAARRELWMWAP